MTVNLVRNNSKKLCVLSWRKLIVAPFQSHNLLKIKRQDQSYEYLRPFFQDFPPFTAF